MRFFCNFLPPTYTPSYHEVSGSREDERQRSSSFLLSVSASAHPTLFLFPLLRNIRVVSGVHYDKPYCWDHPGCVAFGTWAGISSGKCQDNGWLSRRGSLASPFVEEKDIGLEGSLRESGAEKREDSSSADLPALSRPRAAVPSPLSSAAGGQRCLLLPPSLVPDT